MLIIIKIAPTHDSRIFREALKGMEFNVGIGGRVPVNWPYVHRTSSFDSVEAFQDSFAPHAENWQTYPITECGWRTSN
jgi:hypothetical protein